jgi:tRNA threonylcarbamoyl adenosine modification protein YjeE
LARFLETEGFLTEPLAITLEGPLGSGKTTFVKGFGEALGVNPEEIVSPTFSLANTHQGKIQFSHLDLFRLGESSNPNAEFLDSGLDEFLLGIALIEWPERLDDDLYPEMRLKIKIQTLDAASGKSPRRTI